MLPPRLRGQPLTLLLLLSTSGQDQVVRSVILNDGNGIWDIYIS